MSLHCILLYMEHIYLASVILLVFDLVYVKRCLFSGRVEQHYYPNNRVMGVDFNLETCMGLPMHNIIQLLSLNKAFFTCLFTSRYVRKFFTCNCYLIFKFLVCVLCKVLICPSR